MYPSPHCCVTKSRARRCQRSAIPPFSGTAILYYICTLTHKRKFRGFEFGGASAKFTALHFLPRSMSNSDGCQRAFAQTLARPSGSAAPNLPSASLRCIPATAYAAHFTAKLPLSKVTRFQMGRCHMPQQTHQLPVIELLSGFGAEPQLPITSEFEPSFCAWITRSFRRSGSGAHLTSIGVSFFRMGEKRRCASSSGASGKSS